MIYCFGGFAHRAGVAHQGLRTGTGGTLTTVRMRRKGTGLVCRCCGHLVSRADLQRSAELPMSRTAADGGRTQKRKVKKKAPKSDEARKRSEGAGAVCTQCNGKQTQQDEAGHPARLVAVNRAGPAETRLSRVRAHAAKAEERLSTTEHGPVTGEHFKRVPGNRATGHNADDELLRQVACVRPGRTCLAHARSTQRHI